MISTPIYGPFAIYWPLTKICHLWPAQSWEPNGFSNKQVIVYCWDQFQKSQGGSQVSMDCGGVGEREVETATMETKLLMKGKERCSRSWLEA